MQSFTDDYFMKQALIEARLASVEGEVPVGSVIVCNDQIIVRTHNQTERLNDPTAHAEMLAITSAVNILGSKYLPKCSLYVTVEPCAMCAGAIAWAQIGVLVYGASDKKKGFRTIASNVFPIKTIVRQGVMEDECANEIIQFFRGKR